MIELQAWMTPWQCSDKTEDSSQEATIISKKKMNQITTYSLKEEVMTTNNIYQRMKLLKRLDQREEKRRKARRRVKAYLARIQESVRKLKEMKNHRKPLIKLAEQADLVSLLPRKRRKEPRRRRIAIKVKNQKEQYRRMK